MSNNEIIKALECCSEPAGKCCCEECPLHHREDSCTTALIKKALELTNRQKAEIAALSFQLAEAKLTSDIVKQIDKEPFAEVYKAIINEQKAEIERLKNSFDAQASLIEKKSLAYDRICVKHRNEINTAKSEAIKECLTKVKKYIKTNCNPYGKPKFDYDTSIKILNYIDNLLKEMVGDE